METLYIKAKTIAEGWESAVLATWENGARFRTQYDKDGDPESRDVTLTLHITEPFGEPRIHKRFPGGLDDLEIYRNEVVLGVHDHWINPSEGKWSYTYAQRLFNYKVDYIMACGCCPDTDFINQIQDIINNLKKTPYSRRAQAIVWQPLEDRYNEHCPCLQRIWCRVENSKLNMNIHIRSNDAYKAGYMNIFAFTELQKYIAQEIGVEVGEYVHIADSFHIYGSYFNEFEGFLNQVAKTKFEDRVWTTNFAIPMFIDGCDRLLNEENMPHDKKEAVKSRKKYLESLLDSKEKVV